MNVSTCMSIVCFRYKQTKCVWEWEFYQHCNLEDKECRMEIYKITTIALIE